MRVSSEKREVYHSMDVIKKVNELEKQYRSVYWTHVEDDLYVYKPIGRRDYKNIVMDEELSIDDKKDKIVQTCILIPEDFDVDDCVAGIPEILYEQIIKNSLLESDYSVNGAINYFRTEMFDLQNQITCIINEAFPQFDIEEIENWDIEQTAKYLSRAEWKLQNFRNFKFSDEYLALSQQTSEQKEETVEEEKPKQETKQNKTGNKKAKEKLTPEKLAELKAKFPDIHWDDDVIMNQGIEGMRDSVDTLAPALRPGF